MSDTFLFIVIVIAILTTVICAYSAGKYLALAKVWQCMVRSLDEPVSADALEHHRAIADLLKKI